ncbi:MAG TPA: efflux RND transporter permease subunit [Gemmatimonadales bacterium]|nr:efflux RND transporter permease subunit [Gemmatimonadales bacterium]
MNLSDLAIKRPVFASMTSAALVLFGLIGFKQLAVREFPDVDPPIVSVSVTLRGANPQVMESAVTDVLEEQLASLEGLRTMTSNSSEQSSNITLEFNLDRPIEDAAQDVRDIVARVRGRLPQEVEDPVVNKQDADARPMMFIGIESSNHDLLQLSDIADRILKPRLQTVPGLARADVRGERRYAMRVWLSVSALAAHGLTVQDVVSAIQSRNVEIPAGRIESERREFSVRSLGELRTPEEFRDMVVASTGGQIVKLGDLAKVELGPEDIRSFFRFNGRPAVGLSLVRQSKSNLVEVAEAVRAALPELQAALPPGVTISPGYDQSIYVKRSIKEAEETLFLAGGLVVLIIFLFLRNVRATIIPGLAIPASIVATFAVMYALDFSINNLTLLALTLAIGIVVDDAIIVLENAYRHQEELDDPPERAAIEGTREIAFAVIATTISLIAVFTPLAFLTGSTGRLFKEFGIAVAAAVAISGFVALTLTPMLCAKILRVPSHHGKLATTLEYAVQGVTTSYERMLGWVLRHRALVLSTVVALVAGAVLVFRVLPVEFVPPEDRGQIQISLTGPEGATLAFSDQYQREVEQILAGIPEIDNYTSTVGGFGGGGGGGGVNRGQIFVRFVDWSKRERSAQDIIEALRPQLAKISGVQAFANNPPAFGGFGSAVQFVIRNPNFDSLFVGVQKMLSRARQVRALTNVDTDLRINKPELSVSYDRDRAEDLGVPVRAVAGTMQALLGGQRVSTFSRDNKLYYVMVQLSPEERATPTDMSGLAVRGRDNQLIKLDQLAKVNEGVGPRSLAHYMRVRSAQLSAGLAPGFTLGEALDSLERIAQEVLPAGSTTALAGESRELRESGTALYFAFLLALIVVFMVLASQFESLVHPFTVLMAVPLAVTGAIFTLYIAKSSLNLYSQIGMILLIGLVAKNSILLVDYTNRLRAQGMDTAAALIEAGRVRLRPILMTSVAVVMGAIPIALALGAGSISRRPLGYAIVGGVIFSTALTLFVVPVVYSLMEGARVRVRSARHRQSAQRVPAAEVK